MKKIIKIIVLTSFILFCLFFIALCVVDPSGNGRYTVKGENGEKYKSLEECCAAQDFVAAHKYLLKIENGKFELLQSDVEYVYKQEALYLMSIGDDDAKQRIIYLLKERSGISDCLVPVLIDLAIENDDEAFVKTLGNQYTKKANNADLKKLMEFLYTKQSEGNKEYLIGLLRKLDQKELMLDVGFKFKDIDFILNEIGIIKIEDDILLDKLVQLNDRKVSDLIIGSLSPYENEIPQKPSRIGKYTAYNDSGRSEVENYNKGVSRYNKMCNIILNSAITLRNQYLADRSLQRIKENLTFVDCIDKGYDKNDNHLYLVTVSINKEDINNAKSKYQEAVRSGAFK